MANKNFIIENATIAYSNFSGRGDDYNPEGQRNFTVVIEEEDFAKWLIEEGFACKAQTRGDEGEIRYLLKIKVRFDNYPPEINIIDGDFVRRITEDEVGDLDRLSIESVDIEINPSHWARGNREGVSAYLRSMYVTLEENPLRNKYRNIINNMNNKDEEIPFV